MGLIAHRFIHSLLQQTVSRMMSCVTTPGCIMIEKTNANFYRTPGQKTKKKNHASSGLHNERAYLI